MEEQAISSPQTKSVGKNKNGVKIAAIVVIALVVLGAGGYFISNYITKRVAEEAAESILSGATDADVEISNDGEGISIKNDGGSAQYGTNAQWPSDMPSIVPNFTYGKLTTTTNDTSAGKSWSLYYNDVTAGASDSYTSDLVANGWVKDTETTTDGSSYIQMTNGSYAILAIFDTSSQSASIVVSESSSQ